MTSSNWKLTYDPAGTPLVLVAFDALLESDELEPQLDKTVEIVGLVDSAAPFLRVGKNAVVNFSIRVISEAVSDADSRAAMLDSLIAAQTATKKPLRLEVAGFPDRYWQFANATVKSHTPRRLLAHPAPAMVTQWDIVATGLSYNFMIPQLFALVGDSITYAASSSGAMQSNGWGAHARTAMNKRIDFAANGSEYTYAVAGAKASGFIAGGAQRSTWTAALASSAGTVVVCLGANDIAATPAPTNASVISNVVTLWDEAIAAGRKVVGCDIPSCRSDHPVASVYRASQAIVNAGLKAAAASRGMLYMDWAAACDANTDGYSDAAFMGDTIHPNSTGANALGRYAAALLDEHISMTDAIDCPSAFDASLWVTPNPAESGTPGAGTLASGWVTTQFGSCIIAPNLVARTGGPSTNWQEFVVSGNDAADTLIANPTDYAQGYVSSGSIAVVAGERYRAVFEYEIVSGTVYEVECYLYMDGQYVRDHWLNGALSVVTAALPLQSGFLATPPVTIAATGTTSALAVIKVYGNGTVRVGVRGAFKLP